MNKFIIQDEKSISLGTCKEIINLPDGNIMLKNAKICMLCDKLRKHILKKTKYIVNKDNITFIK